MKDSHGILDSILGAFVPIHPDGYKFVAGAALGTLILFAVAPPLGWLAALATAYCAYFFRDPERVTPQRGGLVVSAADGKIAAVADVAPARELQLGDASRARLSVFLSVFDVHIVRAPAAGRIVRSHYVPGAFFNAELDKASEENERRALVIETDQLEAAVGEHSLVLQKDPLRVDPYRALYKLALKMHDYDRAWCMCAALAFLHKADEEEQRFFEDYRPRGMIQVKSRLDNEQWVKNLFHKDENIFIGKIFEMVTPAAIVAKTQALAKAKQLPALDRRFKQDPATSTVTFAKTFGWAAQVLGIQLPDLYVRNDVPGALVAVPSRPPASDSGSAPPSF